MKSEENTAYNKTTQKDKESPEIVIVDAESTEPFLRTLVNRERTRGNLAWLLSGTLCLTILVYLSLTIFSPTRVDSEAFERIWFVLSPLVGLSFAHYFKTP